jgi:hypothetical protein
MQLPRLARECVALLCLLASQILAQCEPDWASANPRPDLAGSSVCSTLWDPDGAGPLDAQLVVGGYQLLGGTQPSSGPVATWDGTKWSVLGSGNFGSVLALTVWNGSLIAGSGNSVLSWNGSSWQLIGSFPAPVRALAVWNGILVAAGDDPNGVVPPLRLWNGSTWTNLPAPPSIGYPKAMISYQGLLYVGGTSPSGQSGVIERWNGSTWAASIITPTSVSGGAISCFAVRPSLAVGGAATLYAGGQFSGIGGSTANSLASTTGGTAWSAVGGNTSSGCYAVLARNVGVTGVEVIASFSQPTGLVRRFSSTTGAWTSLGNGSFRSLIRYGSSYHGTNATTGMACSRWDGTAWVPVASQGLQGEVRALTRSGSDVIVGGAIQATTGTALNGIAQWNGSTFEPLGAGISGSSVDALLTRANGDVVAGGTFFAAGGTATNNIARWNGSTWSAFGTGTNQQVLALCELPNGELIAGGKFTMAGGVACNRIARWNGTVWAPLNFGMNGDVLAFAVRSDGTLFAAGTFTAAGGTSCNRIAQWNGLQWQALGAGCNGLVHALAFRPNGELIAVGAFTSAGGVVADRCARWNGTTWSAMGSSSGDPSPTRSLFVLPNGDVVAGRGFYQTGTTPDAGIARWNGSTWSGFDSGMAGTTSGASVSVLAIAQRADGTLVIGGDFGIAGGLVARGLATLTPTCPASAQPYGTGCSSGTGLLTITADTLPWIGASFRTSTTGLAANSLCFAVIGLTQSAIPLNTLHPQGQPGCTLLTSPDLTILVPQTGGVARSAFALPPASSLLGVTFFQQTIPLELDLAGAIAAVRGSNALSLVIGTL